MLDHTEGLYAILLTTWPWAERSSCFAWGLSFFSFVVDQMQTTTRPSPGQDFESRDL